jgi:D-amino-acid dehydrogenase
VPSYSIPLSSPGKIAKGLKWMLHPESPFSIKPRLDPALLRWMMLFQRASRPYRCRAGIPVLRDLNLGGLLQFQALQAGLPLDLELSHQGFLEVFRTRHGYEEGVEDARLLEGFGIIPEIVGSEAVAEMTGGRPTRAVGGIFYPQDAHIDPRRFVEQLATHVRGMGVEIRESTMVTGFRISGSRIRAVETDRGGISARHFVLAGGAWSPGIVTGLKIDLPMQPAKGYSVTFVRTDACPVIPVGLSEAKTVLTPLGERFRVAGTLEFAGFDESWGRRRVLSVVRSMCDYFPDIDPSAMAVEEIWQGFRPCSPDGLPYLGHTDAYDNLIVAAGHGMLGVTQAPISGLIAAQLAAGERPELNLTPLHPDRFRGLGLFSGSAGRPGTRRMES